MLSVIIGTLNNERALVRTLSALVPAAATGVVREVIITDGGSSDATLEVADIAGCDVAGGEGSLAQRLGAAADKARSEWLMFLRPGAIPDPGWTDEIAQFVQRMDMQGDAVSAAAFRRSNMFQPNRSALAEALTMLKAALFSRVEADQGLVIAKRHYTAVGGHRAAPDPEADLLRQVGRQLVILRSGAAFAPD
jgi:glycosyltransferase involved in cell wall biosynthesis